MDAKFDSRKMHYFIDQAGWMVIYYDGEAVDRIEVGKIEIPRHVQYRIAKTTVIEWLAERS